MRKFVVVIAVVGSIVSAVAADIAWTLQNNTTSDSDVRTDGRCLYAYTPSLDEVNVNGVQFGRYTEGTSQFADDAFVDVSMSRHTDWAGTDKATEWKTKGGSDDYLKLLKNGWYKGSPFPTQLTLTGLTAGKHYLVQFWQCDVRNSAYQSIKTLTVGGRTGNSWGAGFGMNYVGTFTADSATQTIALAYAAEANLNAFQVRCLDEAQIEWTGSWMSGESDIRTDGGELYAYKTGADLTIAGTCFTGSDKTSGSAYGTDITFSKTIGGNPHPDFCNEDSSVPDGAYSYSDAYRKLIDGAYHTSYSNDKFIRRNVTLHHLKPGYRYLVQLWVIDNRNAVFSSAQVVMDWSTVLAHNDGRQYGRGSVAVGTFTAVSTEQTFECYHRVTGQDMTASSSAHLATFGSIQVRCLDDEKGFEGWTVGNTGADGSVDTRGQPIYALSGVETTVSDTHFSCFNGASGGMPSPGDYGDVVIRKLDGTVMDQVWHHGNAFISQSTVEVTSSVTNLLGNGVYRSGSPDEQIVELRNLLPGRRYLVQAWFTDTRRDLSGQFGGRSMQYRILAANEAPLGQYVTGVFRATNDTHSILFEMSSPQLNAIQVRALDPTFDSEIKWENEQTQAGSVSVSTEGTLKYAYAPYAFTTDSGVAFAEGANLVTNLGGGNVVLEHSFENRNTVFAPNETLGLFKNAWYNLPSGISSNIVTLGNLKPTCEYLVQVFVADLRNSAAGTRMLTIGDKSGRYGPNNDGEFPYGSVFTGRFTADTTTKKSFVLKFLNAGSAQLNAIQVREIRTSLAERVPSAVTPWTQDGAGWAFGGIEQTGKALWNAVNGARNSAFVAGDAVLAIGDEVTIGSMYGSGTLTLGTDGTTYGIDVKDDISVPTATVKAVWLNPCVRKLTSGTTVLEGPCPLLKRVDVYDGCVVLDGMVSRELDLTVASLGTLGFTTNRTLPIASLAGDGALAGPGGIVLTDGNSFAVPAALSCVAGFTWGLSNGSTLALSADYDASQLCVSIADPKDYDEQLVVTGDSTVTGKPRFVFGQKGFRAVREDDGWRIKASGLMVIVK